MGNRAVITTNKREVGLYVHWNGGPESICAFLTYAKLFGIRKPYEDEAYFFARLTQIITNFFGGQISCGVGMYNHLDRNNGDNGVYIVNNDFSVTEREFGNTVSFVRRSRMVDFLYEINRSMPEADRLDNSVLEQAEFVEVLGFEFEDEEKEESL